MWQLSRNIDLIWHPSHRDGPRRAETKTSTVLSRDFVSFYFWDNILHILQLGIWGCVSPQQPEPLDSQAAQCCSYHITDSSHFLTWQLLILTGLLKSILPQAQYLPKQKQICTFQLAQDCRLTESLFWTHHKCLSFTHNFSLNHVSSYIILPQPSASVGSASQITEWHGRKRVLTLNWCRFKSWIPAYSRIDKNNGVVLEDLHENA